MKRCIAMVCVFLFVTCFGMRSVAFADMTALGDLPDVKAYLVMESATGSIIAEENAEELLPAAGLVKLMSWLLILENIDGAAQVQVTSEAAGASGTRVFLDAGTSYPADVLLKASIMCSANDATIALAQAMFGSEEGMVSEMNARAQELGVDAIFVDSTGLSDDNKMSARAVAAICEQLGEHSEFFKYSSLYLETFVHESGRETEMVNPNRLVRNDGVDGMATGSSDFAGYNAAVSMKSGTARFVCVVMGATNSDARFTAATAGLNYASGAYSSKNIARAGEKVTKLVIEGSDEGSVDVLAAQDLDVLIKTGERVDTNIELAEPTLPIAQGDVVGTLTVTLPDGSSVSLDLVAGADIKEKTYGYCLQLILGDWLKKT